MVQLPFGTVNRLENTVVFETKLVDPTPFTASAAKVPLNGGVPVARETADAELIFVFVKLSPLPPLERTRLIVLPFGAVRFIVRSPSHVCVILKLTITPVIAPGIPETGMVCDAPIGSGESGSGIFI